MLKGQGAFELEEEKVDEVVLAENFLRLFIETEDAFSVIIALAVECSIYKCLNSPAGGMENGSRQQHAGNRDDRFLGREKSGKKLLKIWTVSK